MTKAFFVFLLSSCFLVNNLMAATSTDSRVLSKNNVEHFVWGDVSDGWWLKDGGSFAIILESMPPHSTEKKHYHKETEQFFYVNEGILSVELGDKKFLLHAHEGITVPEGVAHNLWNDSNDTVSFLVISGPNLKKDRMDL